MHLALDTMVTLSVESNYVNNEQLPVPGVPMPEFNWDAGAVTYGVIDGTNIGYIYVYHHNYYEVSSEFDQAVMSLMGTDGLIIDIRFDWGGSYGLNSGISRLLNHPTSTMDVMERCSPSDILFLFVLASNLGSKEKFQPILEHITIGQLQCYLGQIV